MEDNEQYAGNEHVAYSSQSIDRDRDWFLEETHKVLTKKRGNIFRSSDLEVRGTFEVGACDRVRKKDEKWTYDRVE
jgi:hypothetical protein